MGRGAAITCGGPVIVELKVRLGIRAGHRFGVPDRALDMGFIVTPPEMTNILATNPQGYLFRRYKVFKLPLRYMLALRVPSGWRLRSCRGLIFAKIKVIELLGIGFDELARRLVWGAPRPCGSVFAFKESRRLVIFPRSSLGRNGTGRDGLVFFLW
jgi:hypothetical protein